MSKLLLLPNNVRFLLFYNTVLKRTGLNSCLLDQTNFLSINHPFLDPTESSKKNFKNRATLLYTSIGYCILYTSAAYIFL